MSVAIDVRDAFRIHRSADVVAVALQGLSLQVEEGEIVVVLGPSGSGKTTLLRVLAGFDTLSAGSAHVLGVDLATLGERGRAELRARTLGVLDQHYARALSPNLTSAHSVALSLELLGVPRADARAAATALLERVNLGDRADSHPATLSGGEQQRIALCASLVHRPRLLLADEPGGELDAANAEIVYRLIAELVHERGGSALIVSHDEAASAIADRLVYVRDGRVVEERAPDAPPALVLNDPGWIRIPDPLLEALGNPRRLRATLDGLAIQLDSVTPAAWVAPVTAREAQPRSRASHPVAELQAVTKQFAPAERPTFERLSHRFASGTFHAIVGPSGSGKTTLLHLLAGLDSPTEGSIVVSGEEISRLARGEVADVRRRNVALVTQEPGLVPHLTAKENVVLALEIRHEVEDVERAATRALAEVGLTARLDHRAAELSAGERQRVAIARAIAARPVLLLADEPTARLDHANAHAVGALLAQLAHEGGTAVICATHDETLIELSDAQLYLAGRTASADRAALQAEILR
ncbi:MAG: ABC transporter ATP-binding protein [Gaiellaceae bacterium]